MDIGRAEEQHKEDNLEHMPSDKKNETVASESVKDEEKKELKGGQDENRREKEKREEGTDKKAAPAAKIAEEEPRILEETQDEEKRKPQEWWNVFILFTVSVVLRGFIWMKQKIAAACAARRGAVSSDGDLSAAPTPEREQRTQESFHMTSDKTKKKQMEKLKKILEWNMN